MAVRTGKLVVTREQLAKQFEGFAKLTKEEIALQIGNAEALFHEELTSEIDTRVAAAMTTHNRARHRTLRQRFADLLVRARA